MSSRLLSVQRGVSDMVEGVFRRHGAVQVPTPLLVPHCKLYDNNDSYVCLMDDKGAVVALPYDLRVSADKHHINNISPQISMTRMNGSV